MTHALSVAIGIAGVIVALLAHLENRSSGRIILAATHQFIRTTRARKSRLGEQDVRWVRTVLLSGGRSIPRPVRVKTARLEPAGGTELRNRKAVDALEENLSLILERPPWWFDRLHVRLFGELAPLDAPGGPRRWRWYARNRLWPRLRGVLTRHPPDR